MLGFDFLFSYFLSYLDFLFLSFYLCLLFFFHLVYYASVLPPWGDASTTVLCDYAKRAIGLMNA